MASSLPGPGAHLTLLGLRAVIVERNGAWPEPWGMESRPDKNAGSGTAGDRYCERQVRPRRNPEPAKELEPRAPPEA